MELKSSIKIARALINRYGLQAQAMAEQQAETMARQDPGTHHVWEQVPTVVCEFRRSRHVHDRHSEQSR
jgi:hypothetical protein